MNVIDVHAHLNDDAFKNDLEDVLQRVEQMTACICSGFDLQSSQECLEIADKSSKIFVTVGIHPENAESFSDDFSAFKNLAKNKKVVGIGEIGLDYHYFFQKKENEIQKIKNLQKKAFISQIELANSLNLPIVVHCRDAMEDCLKILQQHKVKAPSVMHCFSGNLQDAKELEGLGFSFSFGGVTTFKNAKNVQEVATKIGLDKILLETDCPYLCPEPFRGKRNEPAFVKYVADKISKLKNISFEDVCLETTKNAQKIFKI